MSSRNYTLSANTGPIAGELAIQLLTGLRVAAESLLAEAGPTVPRDEGTLEDSGTVVLTTDGEGRPVAELSWDTPYAAVQYTHDEYQHRPGRVSHWVDAALENGADSRIADVLAEHLRTGP